jgi:hypothetical protein
MKPRNCPYQMNPTQSCFRKPGPKPCAYRMPIQKAVWTFLAVMVVTTSSFAQLTYTSSCTGSCLEAEQCTYSNWAYTDSAKVKHSFPGSDSMTVVECKFTTLTKLDTLSTDGLYDLQATANIGSVSAVSTFDPVYKLVSILYSPPGNQSGQGYGTSTTNGTTTMIGSSFSFSEQLTFTAGIKDVLSGSAGVGWSTTSTNSSAFTQTWIDATAIATDDNSNLTYNPTKSDSINHNLDSFVLWLNPQVLVLSDGTNFTTPVSYTTGSQPTSGLTTVVADILPPVPAITMEATPPGTKGVTTVPVGYLIPQAIASDVDGVNSYMPGLGAICKNNSLYTQQLTADLATPAGQTPPAICTQANQCGCAPSDFVQILQSDPLLNYNGTTYTATPYAGTESPLELDASGATACGENPVPKADSCRYVIVPIGTGSTTPLFEALSGSDGLTYTVSDGTSTTETTGGMTSWNVSISFGGGPIFANLQTKDTWTWTDSWSVGSTSGTANTMSVALKTSNADCEEDVNIYADTWFHTYAFQVPTLTACP